MQVGVVAVLGAAGVDVATELAVDERLEDRGHLGGVNRVTTRRDQVQGSVRVGDGRGPPVDGRGEVGERAVLVDLVDELVDVGGEVAQRGVFGDVDEHLDHRREEVADARVGVDAVDLEGVVDGDVPGEQRVADRRVVGEQSGELAVACGRGGRHVQRGPQIAGEGAVLGPVRATMVGDRDQGGAFGGEASQLQLVGAQPFVELGVGRPDARLQELVEHTHNLAEHMFDQQLRNRRYAGNLPCRSWSAPNAPVKDI